MDAASGSAGDDVDGVMHCRCCRRQEQAATKQRRKIRQKYAKVMSSGDRRRFTNLVENLTDDAYWELVCALDPDAAANRPAPVSYSTTSAIDEGDGFVSLKVTNKLARTEMEWDKAWAKFCPNLKVIHSTEFVEGNRRDEVYSTRSARRGVLLMLVYAEFSGNVEDVRDGVIADTASIKHLFSQLDFKVLTYFNLTLRATQDTLRSMPAVLAEAPDCVFVVVSSHGYETRSFSDNDIRCSDGELITLRQIIDYFNNTQLPALQGVPKVFVFQNCRGTHVSDSRLYSDMLIAHSTVPGSASRRHPQQGAVFLQAMCEQFAAHAHSHDVAGLFRCVDKALARHSGQVTATETWGFNKLLYLHPGLRDSAVIAVAYAPSSDPTVYPSDEPSTSDAPAHAISGNAGDS